MSWHYSQALAAAYSAGFSADSAPCAPWKSSQRLEPSSCEGRTMEASNHSRSGMMCEPSMESRGVDWWMSLLAASRAKTSQSVGTESESTATEAGCGPNIVESSVRFDLASHSWKTHQCLWEEDLPESSVILPRWGMMLGGELWEVQPLAPAWRVKDFGSSLQRPTASDGKRFAQYRLASLVRPHHPNGNLAEQLAQRGMRRLTPECAEILMHWPEGWTDSEPLETGKIRSWLRSRGNSYLK
jgi:hypothetical protein